MSVILRRRADIGSFPVASVITLTQSGAWQVPDGVSRIEVFLVGGGGGGAGNGQNTSNPGNGGNGGAVVTGVMDVTPGDEIAVVIGAGGRGGDAKRDASNASDGGITSFGALSAAGGYKGLNKQQGAQPLQEGAKRGGTGGYPGEPGEDGQECPFEGVEGKYGAAGGGGSRSASSSPPGGSGGETGGGNGGQLTAGTDGTFYGSAGGGGADREGYITLRGGNGYQGVVIIKIV
jgi:hypothetical protein